MENNLIIDIGMYLGEDTDFYLKKGFNVIAIEANKYLILKNYKRFEKEIKKGKLHIINKAINDSSNKEINFYIDKTKQWSSCIKNWNKKVGALTESNIIINTIELSDIIERFGTPYYIKIDIEGSDVLCLRSLLKVKELPKYLSLELPALYNYPENNNTYLEIFYLLNKLGFKKFKIIEQGNHNLIKCPFPAKEGIYIDYKFNNDCSGLFGKEINNWYDINTAIKEYINNNDKWIDLHASLN